MLLCGVYEIALRQDRILQGVANTVKVLTNIGIDAFYPSLSIPIVNEFKGENGSNWIM